MLRPAALSDRFAREVRAPPSTTRDPRDERRASQNAASWRSHLRPPVAAQSRQLAARRDLSHLPDREARRRSTACERREGQPWRACSVRGLSRASRQLWTRSRRASRLFFCGSSQGLPAGRTIAGTVRRPIPPGRESPSPLCHAPRPEARAGGSPATRECRPGRKASQAKRHIAGTREGERRRSTDQADSEPGGTASVTPAEGRRRRDRHRLPEGAMSSAPSGERRLSAHDGGECPASSTSDGFRRGVGADSDRRNPNKAEKWCRD